MTAIQTILAAAFVLTLAAAAVIDQRTMEIPDRIHLIILGLAAADMALRFFLLGDAGQLLSRGIGLVCVSVPMLLLSLAIEGAFGGGDIKLMGACGLFLGWRLTLTAMFLAVVLGGTWGCVLLLRKKAGRKDHFAFGPFLCAGAAAALFWGEKLLEAYLRLLV